MINRYVYNDTEKPRDLSDYMTRTAVKRVFGAEKFAVSAFFWRCSPAPAGERTYTQLQFTPLVSVHSAGVHGNFTI